MIRLGLIGWPLGHSLSPGLHAAAFKETGLEGEYSLYPVPPDASEKLAEILNRLRAGGLQGLNVTIPHKQTVMPLLDGLTPEAEAIGAVNTISVEGGRLIGHNTDAPGFRADLARYMKMDGGDKKALVLGAGGSARAVCYVLAQDGWDVIIAARRSEQADALVHSMKTHPASMRARWLDARDLENSLDGLTLIVNTTPVGMSPQKGFSPWPMGLAFPDNALVYDLVYNPRETSLMRSANSAGLSTASGLGMLIEQAALAFEIWTGSAPSREAMSAALEEA